MGGTDTLGLIIDSVIKINNSELNVLRKKLMENPVKIPTEFTLKGTGVEKISSIRKQITDALADAGKLSVNLDISTISGQRNQYGVSQQPSGALVTYREITGELVKQKYLIDENGKLILETQKISGNQKAIDTQLTKEMSSQNTQREKAVKQAKDLLTVSDKYVQTEDVLLSEERARQVISLNASIKPGMAASEITKITSQIQSLTDKNNLAKKSFDTTGTSAKTFGDKLKSAFERVGVYSIAMSTLYAAMNQLKQGLQYFVDLQKEMTNIQLINGATDEQIKTLASDYNNLAKELGSTTIEVAKSAEVWIRQGKSAQDATELTKASIMMSKLAMTDAGTAAENLTAIMNGFQMQASDVTSVMDKMLAVSNSTKTSAAVSFNEISTAMKYSAAEAKEVGISFNQLESYISVISTTTRQSAEMVGNAMKTLMARMTSIKAGAEEDGVSLNQVDEVLQRVGISLRDTSGNFIPLGTIIDQIGAKWSSLDSFQKRQIATAVAGIRQITQFTALMENYNNVLDYQKEIADSAGLSQARYAEYLRSVEAAQNELTSSWEKLVSETATKDMVAGFYKLAAGILDSIDALGGIPPLLLTIITITAIMKREALADIFMSGGKAVVYFANSLIGLIPMIGATNAAQTTLISTSEGVVASNIAVTESAEVAVAAEGAMTFGLSLLALAVIYVVTQIIQLNDVTKKLEKSTSQIEKLNTQISSLREKSSSIANLTKEFEDLKKIINPTTEETQKLTDAQNKLKELVPELSGHYDELGNFIFDSTTNMRDLTKATQEQITAEKELLNLKRTLADQEALDLANKINEADKKVIRGRAKGGTLLSAEEIYQNVVDKRAAIDAAKLIFRDMSDAGKKAFIDSINDPALAKQFADAMIAQAKAAQEAFRMSEHETTAIPANTTHALTEMQLLGQSMSDYAYKAREAGTITTQVFDTLIAKSHELAVGLTADQTTTLGYIVDMLKYEMNLQKQAIQSEIDGIKKALDAKLEALNTAYEAQKQNNADKKQALQDELDSITLLISAEKERISRQREEANFQSSLADKNKSLSDLEAQIAALQFDTSAEGIAKRLKLEAEAAAKKKEIADLEANRSDTLANNALDDLQKQKEAEIKAKQDALDDAQEIADRKHAIEVKRLQDQAAAQEAARQVELAAVDAQLQNEGALQAQAFNLYMAGGEDLKNRMISYFAEIGQSIDAYVTAAIFRSLGAMGSFLAMVNSLSMFSSNIEGGGTIYPTPHHTGVDSGRADGLKNNEVITKLTKDEIVFTPKQLKNLTINLLKSHSKPEFDPMYGTPPINIDMPISVAGNMDSEAADKLKDIADMVVKRINDTMKNRGFIRNTSLTSI